MIVKKSSVFPASRDLVFQKLKKTETLRFIAKPYASFEPLADGEKRWAEGGTSSYRLRLFRIIPFGTHTIYIVRFTPQHIRSREYNEHVPVWNHDIYLEVLDEEHTKYTDRVEIRAGWKTVFIWIWAQMFYRHRQKKWIRLLKEHRT